ncbi:uncharacterized protein LOC100181143 [Ciona intestinalis]
MSRRKKKSNEALTADDLKSQMFQSMKSAGVVRQLKVQLRQTMINELRGKGSTKPINVNNLENSDLIAATMHRRKSYSWVQTALDNLVLHHIKQSKYYYTLSLFEQESSVSCYSKSLTEQLLSRLGLHDSDVEIDSSSSSDDLPHSSTPKNNRDLNLILWNILNSISSLATRGGVRSLVENKENKEVKLPQSQPLTLAEKFAAVDEEFDHLPHQRTQRDPGVTVSVLSSAVRRAEEEAERRAKLSYEQWKSVELTKMRLEEANKMKEKINLKMRELEKDYQNLRSNLESREHAAVERLQYHRELMEKELHQQRQTLLNDLEQIRQREANIQQKEEMVASMEATKLKQTESLTAAPTHQPHISQPPASSLRQESFVSSLAESIKHSHDGMQVVTQQEIDQILLEMNEKSKETNQLKTELEMLKMELGSAFKQQNVESVVKSENHLLKENLQELKREIENLKQVNVTRMLSQKKDESQKLIEEIESLKISKHEQDAHQRHLEEMLRNMKQALDDSSTALIHANKKLPNHVRFHESSSRLVVDDESAQIREYEEVDADPMILSSRGCEDDGRMRVAHLATDVRQRLRILDEETSTLDEEYKKYINTNYGKLMKARCVSRVDTDSSRKIKLPIVEKESHKREIPEKRSFRNQLEVTSKELKFLPTHDDDATKFSQSRKLRFNDREVTHHMTDKPSFSSLSLVVGKMDDLLDEAPVLPTNDEESSDRKRMISESSLYSKQKDVGPLLKEHPQINIRSSNLPPITPRHKPLVPNILEEKSQHHDRSSSPSETTPPVNRDPPDEDDDIMGSVSTVSSASVPDDADHVKEKSPVSSCSDSVSLRDDSNLIHMMKKESQPESMSSNHGENFNVSLKHPAASASRDHDVIYDQPASLEDSASYDHAAPTNQSASRSQSTSHDHRASREDPASQDHHASQEDPASRDHHVSREDPASQNHHLSREDPASQNHHLSQENSASHDHRVSREDPASHAHHVSRENSASHDHHVSRENSALHDHRVSRENSASQDHNVSRENSASHDHHVSRENSASHDHRVSRENSASHDHQVSPEHPASLEKDISLNDHHENAPYHLEPTSENEDDTISSDGDRKKILSESSLTSSSSKGGNNFDRNRFSSEKVPEFKEDDISDILRWEDQHRPRLDTEGDDDQTQGGDVESDEILEQLDPFEMSDPQLSLESGSKQHSEEDSW